MRIAESTAGRRDRLIRERVHDPYKSRHKPPEPSVCKVCHAVFHGGRWQRAESWPIEAHQTLCQACQRMRDDYPAGVITLTGSFIPAHKDEILGLVRHHEQEENAEHVLHRIMRMEEGAASLVILTTDLHLPRRIGEALRRAFKGDLQLQYEDEGCFLRVNWQREA